MSDLPNLGSLLQTRAQITLIEGDGYDGTPVATTELRLGAADLSSLSASMNPLVRSSIYGAAYSCERWFKVYFQPPFTRISAVRYWFPDYAPNDGWEIRSGTSAYYRKPVTSQSDIATRIVPTSDPATSLSVPVSAVTLDTQTVSTDWIVLQAVSMPGSQGATVQSSALTMNIAWTEV